MSNVNNIILEGRLVSDPDQRTTPNGKFITSFTLASDAPFSSKDKNSSIFMDVVFFGEKNYENIPKFFKKGSRIIVKGVISQNQWEDKDGNKRSKHQIMGDTYYFLDTKKDSNEPSSKPQSSNYSNQNNSRPAQNAMNNLNRNNNSNGGYNNNYSQQNQNQNGDYDQNSRGNYSEFEDDIPF